MIKYQLCIQSDFATDQLVLDPKFLSWINEKLKMSSCIAQLI